MFPPGRAKLATRFTATGSPPAPANTIGMVQVARFAATTASIPTCDNHADFKANELDRDVGIMLFTSFTPSVVDQNVAAIAPNKFAQPLHKNSDRCAASITRGTGGIGRWRSGIQ